MTLHNGLQPAKTSLPSMAGVAPTSPWNICASMQERVCVCVCVRVCMCVCCVPKPLMPSAVSDYPTGPRTQQHGVCLVCVCVCVCV